MSAPNAISIEKLVRFLGTPKCPTLINVRPQSEFDTDRRLIPSSSHDALYRWCRDATDETHNWPTNKPRP
jgi:hypothetical protein